MIIHYSFHTTPFGTAFIASTQQGICYLSFVDDGARATHLKTLTQQWPNCTLQESPSVHQPLIEQLFTPHKAGLVQTKLHLHGTPFQQTVWRALLKINPGTTTTYSALAQSIGKPTAVRAVANAIANNRIAFLIPCHRVIKKNGQLHNYRWGADRKKLLLAWENS